MTKKEVATLLKRIQTHYSSLVVDDFMIDEWFKELKEYKLEEVNEKLEQHLRNAEYGSSIPKLYYLTRYLTKPNQMPLNGRVQCRFCGQFVKLKDSDKHFERCLDVNYLYKVVKLAEDSEIDKGKYIVAEEESFKNIYYKILEKCVKKITDESEIKRINKILSSRLSSEIDIQNESFDIGKNI